MLRPVRDAMAFVVASFSSPASIADDVKVLKLNQPRLRGFTIGGEARKGLSAIGSADWRHRAHQESNETDVWNYWDHRAGAGGASTHRRAQASPRRRATDCSAYELFDLRP
jgi:hypothetical protein